MVRLKHRYLICQALDESTQQLQIDEKDVIFSLRTCIQTLFGDVGAGEFGNSAVVKLFDPKSKIFVLRVSRDFEIDARFALSCVNNIKKSPAIIRTIATSGSARNCRKSLTHCFDQLTHCAPTDVEMHSLKATYSDLMNSYDL